MIESLDMDKLSNLFFEYIQKQYGIKTEELISTINEKTDIMLIPIQIFKRRKLSPFECIVKYLKENLNKSYIEIAKLTNRHYKTVWTTYRNTEKKSQDGFIINDTNYKLPLSIINDRKYSNLEIIVKYLKEEYGLSKKEISRLMVRSESTIATISMRASKK